MVTIRLGTRGSRLALWQAEWVRKRIAADIEIVSIRTKGDEARDERFADIGVGVFTRELDRALLDGEIDLAVHSLKDLPTVQEPGIALASVPPRESPLDCFISCDGTRVAALPAGARIGTSSPRRRAQILHLRPDLAVEPLRGNVETRLERIASRGLAGTLLAHAGLVRLGLSDRATEVLPAERFLPAPGQGALAIVARDGDARIAALLAPIDDFAARTETAAERAFLRALGGGCQLPVGALACARDGRVRLSGFLADPDGAAFIRDDAEGWADEAEAVGLALAHEIIAAGGGEILKTCRRSP
ncbi:MAG: hydroxymethylbilane synthase [Planctomycetes bacterium]|nr:hydroxymethylbilane synthase [Planctomycetota bacterium]